MEAIYPISSLQKDQKAPRRAAGKDPVRIQQEREDTAYETRMLEAVARGAADIAAGRCCAGDKAIERMQALRQPTGKAPEK